MNNKLPQFLAATALLSLSASAYSDDYFGLNLSKTELDTDVLGEDPSMTALYLRGGTAITDYFDAELRLGIGVGNDQQDTPGAAIATEAEVAGMAGGYVRGHISVTDYLSPYVIVGWTHMEIGISGPGANSDEKEDGLSYGAGVDINLSEVFGFNIEYMTWSDNDDAELTGLSAGVIFNF